MSHFKRGGNTQIVSLSNSSLDTHPQNTLTKFTHHLPAPIIYHNRARIGLSQLIISTKLKSKQEISHVKVHLEELEGDSVAGNDSKVLALLPWDNSSNIFWGVIEHPVYLPLTNRERLTQLNILLTDQNNDQLQLADGPTSIAILEMEKGEENINTFSITVDADMSKLYYPNNTLSSWLVELPQSFRVDSSWEVCLHSIQAPKDLLLRPDIFNVILHRAGNFKEESPFDSYEDDETKEINLELKSSYSEMNLIFLHLQEFFVGHGIEMRYDLTNGAIDIRTLKLPPYIKQKFNIRTDKDEFSVLEFGPGLCQKLGIDYKPGLGRSFKLPPPDGTTLTLREGQAPGEYDKMKNVISEPIQHLALYSNLVDESIIGNSIAPIVDIFPTKNIGLLDNSKPGFYALKNPVYRGVSSKISRTIAFQLRSLDGKVTPLTYSKTKQATDKFIPMYFTFIFRKKQ